ncbi:MAG: hypothetical protein BGO67_10170 [Alphaproteobacteria bacterium 41-28]|nr:MAG: hypothetical protein BGO67_10170 [Alphaproteobacteria bacterium 41-28]
MLGDINRVKNGIKINEKTEFPHYFEAILGYARPLFKVLFYNLVIMHGTLYDHEGRILPLKT